MFYDGPPVWAYKVFNGQKTSLFRGRDRHLIVSDSIGMHTSHALRVWTSRLNFRICRETRSSQIILSRRAQRSWNIETQRRLEAPEATNGSVVFEDAKATVGTDAGQTGQKPSAKSPADHG